MNTPRETARMLLLLGALGASMCACSRRSALELHGTPDAGASKGGPTAPPALWEPVDESFTGCERG
jgi:hypothetical protein